MLTTIIDNLLLKVLFRRRAIQILQMTALPEDADDVAAEALAEAEVFLANQG